MFCVLSAVLCVALLELCLPWLFNIVHIVWYCYLGDILARTDRRESDNSKEDLHAFATILCGVCVRM